MILCILWRAVATDDDDVPQVCFFLFFFLLKKKKKKKHIAAIKQNQTSCSDVYQSNVFQFGSCNLSKKRSGRAGEKEGMMLGGLDAFSQHGVFCALPN